MIELQFEEEAFFFFLLIYVLYLYTALRFITKLTLLSLHMFAFGHN